MKKSVKKYQPGGLVDSEGNPVRDGSGNPIMTGSFPDEDEITARGRAKNAEMLKSFFNRATGRGKETPAAASAGPAAGTSSLRDPQQMAEQKAAPKFSDGDVDERDRRMEAMASMPARTSTSSGQSSPKASAPKASVAKAPVKAKPSSAPAATTSRGRGAEKGSTPKQTMGGIYSNEGRGRPAPAAKPKTAATSAVASKQREADEKRREERREFGRQRDAKEAAQKEKFTKDLSSDPKQMAIRKEREAEKRMSPSERSAARGKSIKEFFGVKSKPNLDPKGAMIQSMDTDVMRNQSRAAAKRNDKATYKQGGSVSSASKRADGIAQRGKTRGKVY